jgi:hypothetical protein
VIRPTAQHGADGAGVLADGGEVLGDPDADRRADGVAAEHAGEDADGGDADLHGRQEALRVLGQFQRLAGARAVLGALLQPRLARGDHRHLRQREEGIQQDQEQDDQQLNHGRGPACGWHRRMPATWPLGGHGRSSAAGVGECRPWDAPGRVGIITGHPVRTTVTERS